jgi:hypothetical protein
MVTSVAMAPSLSGTGSYVGVEVVVFLEVDLVVVFVVLTLDFILDLTDVLIVLLVVGRMVMYFVEMTVATLYLGQQYLTFLAFLAKGTDFAGHVGHKCSIPISFPTARGFIVPGTLAEGLTVLVT